MSSIITVLATAYATPQTDGEPVPEPMASELSIPVAIAEVEPIRSPRRLVVEVVELVGPRILLLAKAEDEPVDEPMVVAAAEETKKRKSQTDDGEYTPEEVAAGVWIVSMKCLDTTTLLCVFKTEAEADAWCLLHPLAGNNVSAYPREDFKCATYFKTFMQFQEVEGELMGVRRPNGISFNPTHPGERIENESEQKARQEWSEARAARYAPSKKQRTEIEIE